MKLIYDDEDFDGQVQRTLGYTRQGGGDLGEALSTAARITPGDRDGWYAAWTATADRVRRQAEDRSAKGRRVSAREGFLRASNYYRAAEFFVRDSAADPRSLAGWRAQRDCFRAATSLMDVAVDTFEVPYDGTTLPGYVARPDDSRRSRPTVLTMTGLDGTAEEVWFSVAAAGVERGYTVVVYDGPGQGGPLREHGMVLRPDWEAVVSPVIDVAVTLPGVDGDRMALVGRSFGGYLAPRAATVERRIAALVADPGQVDEGQAAAGRLPAEMLQAVLADHAKASAQVETVLSNPQRRFYFQARMRAFGASTVAELIRILQAYRFDPADIRCPTLVTDNVADVISGGQSKMLYDGLTCPKDYVLFTAEEGAEGHCEGLAQSVFSERLYDWLDQALDPTKGT